MPGHCVPALLGLVTLGLLVWCWPLLRIARLALRWRAKYAEKDYDNG